MLLHTLSHRFLLLFILAFLGANARGESVRAGQVAQVVKESDVFKDPGDRGSSYGKLPSGTLLTLTGERSGDFVGVEVELEDGNLEGWIRRDSIERQDDAGEDPDEQRPGKKATKKKKKGKGDDDEPDTSGEPRRRNRRRVLVPKDEGLLLRRETSFFYGLQAGGNFSIMNDDLGTLYFGPGFTAGAHFGYFFTSTLPARVEANYSLLNGTAQDGGGVTAGTLVSFGFFDIAGSLQWQISGFEVFGTVQYSYGLSVNDIPKTIKLVSPADLSSLWIGGGAGYRIPLGEVTDLVLRGRYLFSLLRAPVGFQTFTLTAFLEFSG